MIYNYFLILENTFTLLKLFIGLSLLLSSIQHVLNRHYFECDNLLSWEVLKKRKQFRYFRSRFFYILMDGKGFLILNILRICLLITLIINYNSTALIVFLTLLTYLIYLRSALFCNAADQINNIALMGIMLHQILGDKFSAYVVACFLALVILISYFTSGLLKVHEEKWRNGEYLKKVLIVRANGNPRILRPLKLFNNGFIKLSSQIVIFWELGSILVPFMPIYMLCGYVLIGIVFHISTGILMGLGNFIWTFIGLLPTLIILNSVTRHILSFS